MIFYGEIAEWIGWVGDESGLNNAKRVLARKGSFPLELHFLEPFSPEDHHGRKAIAAKARDEIEEALIHALGKPLREYEYSVDPVRYQAPEKNIPLE
jgi:1-acyl-sn-glycerol-3-phosphate acyltransferase